MCRTFSLLVTVWDKLKGCTKIRASFLLSLKEIFSEMFCYCKTWNNVSNTLWNISLCSMWNEINPYAPQRISHCEAIFHTQSVFHKSRKGFISLRCVLTDTTHRVCFFYFLFYNNLKGAISHPLLEKGLQILYNRNIL